MICAAISVSTFALASGSTTNRVRFTTALASRYEIAPEANTSATRGSRSRSAHASRSSLDATPGDTFSAAATSADTASQLSRHHCSRSPLSMSASLASSRSAIAASRCAAAAFSTRAHAPTAAAPRDRDASDTNRSNMLAAPQVLVGS
ncbi:hypothetical protein ASJ79_04030 [Mycobacterium sp. NAZ190054]|nr:hypothetical protein ASJ79_04030 [Mycobacterium sp. NAZ190054]